MASNDYQIHWTYPDGERGYGRHRLTKAAAEKICVDANKAEQCEGMTYTVETHNGDEGGKYLNYMEHLTPKVSAKISALEEENKRLMRSLSRLLKWIYFYPKDCHDEYLKRLDIKEAETRLEKSNSLRQESEADENVRKCHDCGVMEGEFHVPGCDAERCPFCGGQLISCSCMKKHFDIDYDEDPSSDQFIKWEELLKEKGLILYGKENN